MMDESGDQQYITSKDILSKTGISRATLNNYIKMGILPKPVVRKAGKELQGTKHIGYFPESVIWRIDLVKRLKQEGEPMERIARQFGKDSQLVEMFPESGENEIDSEPRETDPGTPLSMPEMEDAVSREIETSSNFEKDKRRRTDPHISIGTKDLKLTVSDLDMPAYLVNHNFEIEWVNREAENLIFNTPVSNITEVESRNIFKLFFGYEFHSNISNWKDIVSYHMPFLRSSMSKDALSSLYPGMSEAQSSFLQAVYDTSAAEPLPGKTMGITSVKLARNDGTVEYFQVHSMLFREGIFFVYAPGDRYTHDVTEYLSKREVVINELLKQRIPALVSLCVLVADLQDSVKISAELLPGEYFSLINSLWESLAGCFEKYGGIYGKHAGDGMLYYFIKKPGTNYVMNSIDCALELRKRMKEFSSEWKIKKGWLDDMYLNIGINEGQEFFGTIRSAPTVEFTALGDSINYAGRLSDFARYGEIWTTKSVIGKLNPGQLEDLRFGVNRNMQGRTIFTPNGFSRMIDIMGKDDHNYGKFIDIATLPITQIMDPVN
jgi:adenylate cyclase